MAEYEKTPGGRYAIASAADGGPDFSTMQMELFRALIDANRLIDPVPLSSSMLTDLMLAMQEVVAGFSPELLTPAKRRGGREPPILKNAQRPAILYLHWVDAGAIVDRSPRRTVSEAYGVDHGTVSKWRLAHRQVKFPEPRADMPTGLTDAEALKWVTKQGARVTRSMKVAGEVYQEHSRGKRALGR